MEYSVLGNSGFKISQISFGCMSLQPDKEENQAIIGDAIAGGINFFDTADLYDKGANEQLLGAALKGRRKDVYVSTKVGNRWRSDGSGWDWCPGKGYILSAVDASLKRLQTDYIDLYLLHGGTMEDPADEVIEAFQRLQDMGKIRAYGISSIRPNVIRRYTATSDIAAVMTQYSYLDRRPEEQTLQLLEDNHVGVLARGTVAGGLLIDKPPVDYLGMPAGQVQSITEAFRHNLPEYHEVSAAAFGYVTGHTAVTSAVAGIRTASHLRAALAAGERPALTYGQLSALRNLWPGNKYAEHR